MTETIQESHIATNQPPKQKKLWIGIVGGIVAILVLAVGFQAYKKHAFKSALRPYALKDNILIEDMLNLESEGKITYADYFDKAKKNIEAREQLIQDISLIDPGSYKTELDMYLEILKLENKYIQYGIAKGMAYIAVKMAKNKIEPMREICNINWYSWCSADISKAKRDIEAAATGLVEKTRESRVTSEQWLSKEKEYNKTLSAFLPARNLIPKLEYIVKLKSDDSRSSGSIWWIYSAKTNDCTLAEANYTPDQIMKSYPECKIASNENGLLNLDCSQSKLKSSFLYGDSKEACLKVTR